MICAYHTFFRSYVAGRRRAAFGRGVCRVGEGELACNHVHACSYVIICVCVYVCMYVCMYIYIYIYVYMYICIYTPMYAPRPPPGSARPRPRRRPRRSSARPPAECGFGPCRVVYTSTRSLLGWLETRLAQIT